MPTKCYLAIDLGASSGRVLAGLFENEKLELKEMHRFWNGAIEKEDGLHWDIDQLFTEIKTGLKNGFAAYGSAVQAIGVDTWGVDYGLLDANGKLVNTPFQYRDARTDGMMEKVFKTVPKAEVYNRTGLQFMFFNTLYQLSAELSRPDFKKAEQMLFMPDLLNYWLTGKAATEYTIASTSQLLDAKKRDWDFDLIEKLGLPKKIFGKIVPPGTVLGSLTAELQKELGGNAQVIAVGGHDTASAVAAAPLANKDCAYLSSGTWSLMGLEESNPIITAESAKYDVTNEGGVCNTIRFLKNIGGLWLLQECRRNWMEQGEELDFIQIAELAMAAEPFVAFINPDAPEFAKPCDMPAAIQAFCKKTGQRVPQTKGEIARTAYESLAMRYRSVFQTLEKLHGRRLEKLHIVGGGCQNKVLNQFSADALNRPIVAGPIEATAIGNILMQMIAKGDVGGLAEGRAMISESFAARVILPEDTAAWDKAFERFTAIV
ncbi:MAG: rhamnulokinase [Kiritimatiellaceae bacterium]|nr:rhamnulokinase [Kiritimatiellaceae bacterium]